MKGFGVVAAICLFAFYAFGDASLEQFAPHFAPKMPIYWHAPTNNWPKDLWTYQKLPPRPFSSAVVSNAFALASLKGKKLPRPSTNDFHLSENRGPSYPGPIPIYFSIAPKAGSIFFTSPNPGTNTSNIPTDSVLIQRARDAVEQLGVEPGQIELKEMTSHFNQDADGNQLPNSMCGRGVFLSRKLDGVLFLGNGQDSNDEGFRIEFGSAGQIRSFSLVWPQLQRIRQKRVVTPGVIVECIRFFKTLLLPERNESDYLGRVKTIAAARYITIKKVSPFYGEGKFGEQPDEAKPDTYVGPIVAIDAVASSENSNLSFRLIAPLVEPDVNRLLRQTIPH